MNTRQIIKILVVSALLGAIIGLASSIFIWLYKEGTNLIWTKAIPGAINRPLAVISIALVGGLLLGLCIKFFGTNKGIGVEAVLGAASKDGGILTYQIPRVVLNTLIGLLTGASVGPEAPTMTLGGYLGDRLARLLKVTKEQLMAFIAISLGSSLSILVESPIAGPILITEQQPTKDKKINVLLVMATLIASSIGFGVYLEVKHGLLTGLTLVPAYPKFRFIDLLYALILGFIGFFLGYVLKIIITDISRFFQKYFHRFPITRGLIVGLLIGVIGAIWPLVLFDGSGQLHQLLSTVGQYSILMLFVLGIMRIITTGVALGGGYQGGNIFPTIFFCGAIGLAINAMIPAIPASVAMVTLMVSATYMFLRFPLLCIFLYTELSSTSLIPAMAIALIGGYVIVNLISIKDTSTSSDQVQSSS